MTSIGSPSPFFLAGKKAYEVERSLRFNSGDSPELTRTPSGAGNRKTWTLSFWAKISNDDLGSHGFLFSSGADSSNKVQINLESSNRLTFEAKSGGSTQAYIRPSNNLRDISAWYHFVIRVDTTDSTSTNRIKIYINGTQQTDLALNTFPSEDAEFEWNKAQEHNIGKRTYSSNYFNGYLAEINFIDGQAYDSSYFGKTDPLTGQWNPKRYGGSYGTNGFYLNFSENSGTTATTLGKDFSGNGNNFTPNNFSVAANLANDSMPDTPTNNFCTLNPLNATSSFNFGINDGNLVFDQSSNDQAITGTFFITSGKWYWEIYKNSGQNPEIGICGQEALSNQSTGVVNRLAFITNGGNLRTGSSSTTGITGGSAQTGAGWIRIAVDMDNKKIWFSDTSGNYFNSGNPATGANAAYDFSSHTVADGWTPYIGMFTGSGHNCYVNFGQFELNSFSSNIPTGFATLSSANLPEPTIKLPNKHSDTVTYTGSGSGNQSITTLNFQPDWVWLKVRSTGGWHALVDSVRGVGKILASNEKDAENNSSDSQTAFSAFLSNGFTVGYNSSWYVNGTPSGSATQVAWNWNAGDADSKTYKVKVVADSTDYGHGTGSNKYQFFKSDGTTGFGTNGVDLDLEEGGTYIFDWSDSSAQNHPIRFSLTNDGTHSSGTSAGTEYTTGVTKDDSAYKTTITIASGVANLFYYCQNHSGMGAEINTNTTKGSTNFDGSTKSVVKANTTAGFSIVTYTGQQNASDTIGHGLGVKPQVVITKSRNSTYTYTQWYVYHHKLSTNHFLFLNETNAQADGVGDYYIDASFSSTVFAVGDDIYGPNVSSNNYIAYCFSEVAGYSKFGNYIPNQNDNGPFVYTGFRPRWILLKSRGNIYGGGSPFSGNWYILDTERSTFNVAASTLASANSNAEDNAWGTEGIMDILSNGFKIRTDSLGINATLSGSFIYLAFAEAPFKYARAR